MRGAAAAADDVDAELGDEAFQPVGERFRFEREVGLVAAFRGKPGVRQHADESVAVPRSGACIASQHQVRADAQFMPMTSISSSGASAISAAGISVPGSIFSLRASMIVSLHHERQADARLLHLLDGRDGDALRLEDVEARLDQDRIDAFFDHDAVICGRYDSATVSKSA